MWEPITKEMWEPSKLMGVEKAWRNRITKESVHVWFCGEIAFAPIYTLTPCLWADWKVSESSNLGFSIAKSNQRVWWLFWKVESYNRVCLHKRKRSQRKIVSRGSLCLSVPLVCMLKVFPGFKESKAAKFFLWWQVFLSFSCMQDHGSTRAHSLITRILKRGWGQIFAKCSLVKYFSFPSHTQFFLFSVTCGTLPLHKSRQVSLTLIDILALYSMYDLSHSLFSYTRWRRWFQWCILNKKYTIAWSLKIDLHWALT